MQGGAQNPAGEPAIRSAQPLHQVFEPEVGLLQGGVEDGDEANLRHCSAHGLRKAAATRAAESGATARQLLALFGWLNIKEAERYTKAAQRRKLASAAPVLLRRPDT